jgi:hypothetical protein
MTSSVGQEISTISAKNTPNRAIEQTRAVQTLASAVSIP